MSNLQAQIDGLLTWQRVRAWAAAQPVQCVIGQPADGGLCPLACYLNEQSELPARIYVGIQCAGPAGGEFANLPHWATRVVLAVDEHEHNILREQFIRILDKCKPEEE